MLDVCLKCLFSEYLIKMTNQKLVQDFNISEKAGLLIYVRTMTNLYIFIYLIDQSLIWFSVYAGC